MEDDRNPHDDLIAALEAMKRQQQREEQHRADFERECG